MDNKMKPTEITRYRFNLAQFSKMAAVGILPQHGPEESGAEELKEGVVLESSPSVTRRNHPMLKGGITRFLNQASGLTKEDRDRIHKYTVDEYHVMVETGILTPDERVELIDGEIVQMPPISSSHASVVNRIVRLLNLTFGVDEAIVWSQCPITFPINTEPEPDVALLRPRADFYRSNLPTPQDALLLIEVSRTTLRYDRTVKLPLYALAGIPEVWLVNLTQDTIEVYRDPEDGAYLESNQFRTGGSVSTQAFPNLRLAVEELLG
jgi:Uma2 family endonuclease